MRKRSCKRTRSCKYQFGIFTLVLSFEITIYASVFSQDESFVLFDDCCAAACCFDVRPSISLLEIVTCVKESALPKVKGVVFRDKSKYVLRIG